MVKSFQSKRENVNMIPIVQQTRLPALKISVEILVGSMTHVVEEQFVKQATIGQSANVHLDGEEILTNNATNVSIFLHFWH